MKNILVVAVFGLLMGCSVVTKQLDERTGTTIQERCVDYNGVLAAAMALQATAPTADRAARIIFYRTFVESNCLGK